MKNQGLGRDSDKCVLKVLPKIHPQFNLSNLSNPPELSGYFGKKTFTGCPQYVLKIVPKVKATKGFYGHCSF